MKECDESINATGSRKKKRGSSFRYSSKKVFDRCRLTRLAKARVCELKSVTRTLCYPSLMPSEECVSDLHETAAISFQSPVLASIDEFDEEREETSNVDQLISTEYTTTVSSFSID
jgi:hypothetical protein